MENPKVALVSIGIGKFQRGFERYFSDLFGVLRDELDITLYKSGGQSTAQERIPKLLRPLTATARPLPLGVVAQGAEYRYYKNDCLAFALALLPEILRQRFDVIHVIDFPLAVALGKMRRWLRLPFRLVFTNGSWMPPQYCPAGAHVHHVARLCYEEALAAGVPETQLTMVPCGVHIQRFASRGRRAAREKYGISDSTFVIAAVSAVKRMHKRVDHIIEEVSRLKGDILLWIDGAPEDGSIPHLARERLGSRCRITKVASGEVGEIYNAADVMVHAALTETFGLAIVEGISTGLPVLVHDSPHFEWLVEDRDCLVDMSAPGKLAARLATLQANMDTLRKGSQVRAARVRQRFEWRVLVADYLAMYGKVAESSAVREDQLVVSQ
jgi:glycosyltransferase involved in cell wall biosynthesis